MFFAEHEKTIYQPPDSARKFDPLALDRALTIHSGGKVNEWLKLWQGGDSGDVSPGGRAEAAVMAAEAEGKLAELSRAAFGLPEFPEATDAHALEWLCDYLRWMEGKGSRGSAPPPSPGPSPAA